MEGIIKRNNNIFVVAPMVDASELAWRLLSRKYGAQLCYTPMFHSNVFIRDNKYRKDSMVTCPEDRPLLVQFCGNDPESMAKAAEMVESECDGIDINLGCPQAIAKRGRYGSFLQDDWELVSRIVSTMTERVSKPITCKIRVFNDVQKTIDYALMLQQSGCKMLTVHGRTREQKGPLTGVANWDQIKAVKEAVSIPVLANGNIQCLQDVNRCIEYTGVDGVMSAEGNLTNPALFLGINPVTWEIAEEYLNLLNKYPCPTSYIRGHFFKIFHKVFALEENNQDRELLATAQNLNDFHTVCKHIKEKYEPLHNGTEECPDIFTRHNYDLLLPPWLCQPYVRMTPWDHQKKMESLIHLQTNSDEVKRIHEDHDGNIISRKKMKKLKRLMRRPIKNETASLRSHQLCCAEKCPNPLGFKCEYKLCKKCCKNKCYTGNLDCTGHRILVKTRRDVAKQYAYTDIEIKQDVTRNYEINKR